MGSTLKGWNDDTGGTLRMPPLGGRVHIAVLEGFNNALECAQH